MSVFFTSDLHLGHRNIHEYRKDKFNSQVEHDEYILNLIDSLNKRDTLMVLGDFIFDSERYDYYVERLSKAKCRIKVVMGNHDSLKMYKESCLEVQLPLYSYKKMWVSHAPIHPKELRSRLGNVHGHIHNTGDSLNDTRYFNVNIDVNNYEFVVLDTIKEYFKDDNVDRQEVLKLLDYCLRYDWVDDDTKALNKYYKTLQKTIKGLLSIDEQVPEELLWEVDVISKRI